MAKQNKHHQSKHYPYPIHKAQKITTEKYGGLEDTSRDRNHTHNRADNQRTPPDRLHHRRWHQVEIVYLRRAHLRSCPPSGFATNSGKVAPEGGSPRNCRGSDGTFCPVGTSATVAAWLNCSARM